jgi:hypothetical protein
MTIKRLFFLALFSVVIVSSLLITFLAPHRWVWLWDHLYHDFWPLDSSRIMPNILASTTQWLVIGIVATFLYQPLKRWIDAELDHLNAKIEHAIKENPNVAELPDYLKGRPNER